MDRGLHTPTSEIWSLKPIDVPDPKQIYIQAPTPNYTNRSHHKGGTPKYKSWSYFPNRPKCSRPQITLRGR